MSAPRVYLCLGNDTARNLDLAVSNLLVETRLEGRSPLLVCTGSVPFPPASKRPRARDDGHFDRYTALEVPAVELSRLPVLLSDPRRRRSLLEEEGRLSEVFVYDPRAEDAGLFGTADELLLFALNDASSSSWAYGVSKRLLESGADLTVRVVVTGTGRIEEAAAAFHRLSEEIDSMLGGKVRLVFGGCILVDGEHVAAADQLGKTVVELFKGGRFHGMVAYIARNLLKDAAVSVASGGKSFFEKISELSR